jgi:hypothetical protein
LDNGEAMLENVADGFLGLFMFFTHWLSPGTSDGEIKIAAVKELQNHSVLECIISFEWDERMIDLIDAGIPVSFRIESYSDVGDTTRSVRTLYCDVSDYSYCFRDSLCNVTGNSICRSKKFNQVYRAIKEYRHFTRTFTNTASLLRIEAVLLPSRVSHLNRSIDLSEICGCRKFSTEIVRKEKR